MTGCREFLEHSFRPGLASAARGFFSVAAVAAMMHGQPVLDGPQTRAFHAAEQAFADQRYEEAAAGYASLAEQVPEAAELHAKLGLSQFFNRRCDRSAPAFQRALELHPDLKAGRVLLAICLSELGRYDEALDDLRQGYQDPPGYPGVKRLAGLELVRTYLGLGHHARAAGLIAELQAAHPEDPEVLFHANRTYREVATRAAFDLARVAPESVWTHQAMGEAYESSQYHDLAIMEYRKALQKQPSRPGLRYRLGEVILAKAGDPSQASEALEHFEAELVANPSHAPSALRAGEIHSAHGRQELALEYLERAVALRTAFSEAQLALGKLLLDLQRFSEAIIHLEDAVDGEPGNPAARYQLARAYRSSGNLEGSQEQLEEYRKLQSDRRERDQQILLGSPVESPDPPPASSGGPP